MSVQMMKLKMKGEMIMSAVNGVWVKLAPCQSSAWVPELGFI